MPVLLQVGDFAIVRGTDKGYIEYINKDLIVIFVSRMQSTTRNTAGIFVLSNNPDSHFPLPVMITDKTDFEIRSKSNLPSKPTQENYDITQ